MKYDEAMLITENILSQNDYRPLVKICLWLKTELLLYGKYDYAGALACLEQIPLGPNRLDSLSYYGYKAILAERKGDSVTADQCIRRAEPFVRTGIDSLTLWNQKSDVYEIRENYQRAFASLDTATRIQSRIITELLGQSVTRELENHYRQSLKEEKETSRHKTVLLSLSLILLLLVIAISAFIIHRQHLSHIQDMVDIENLNDDIKSLRRRNNQFRSVSDTIIIERVQFLQHLSESYFSWSDEQVRKSEKLNGISTREEIISRFRHQLGDLRSDKNLLASLESAINASQDNIMDKVREVADGKMKENDFTILTLLLSGLSIKSISFLLKMSEPALRTRKSRYKQFFSSSHHPSSASIAACL